MGELTVKIKPLTPLWTGDEKRECNTLRETGIIGSLRWWYEALIRGLGGSACDPTNTTCDGKDHCAACELFGCSGWARKFKLKVEFNSTTIPKVWIGTREKRNGRYLKRNVAGFMSDGTIILEFVPLREITPDEWALLNKILKIISNYGTLGAKASQGNGVIKIVENNLPCRDRKLENVILEKAYDTIKSPNLNDFFFYKFHIRFSEDIFNLINDEVFWTHQQDHHDFADDWENWKKLWNDYHILPIAFHMRDSIRHLEDDKNKRHEIFGEFGKGSRVFVSHGYKIDNKMVEIRIWGYTMEESIKNKIKKELKNKLKEKLFSNGNQQYLERCILKDEKSGRQLLEESK